MVCLPSPCPDSIFSFSVTASHLPDSLTRNPGVLLHLSHPRHHGSTSVVYPWLHFLVPRDWVGPSSSPCEWCMSLWAAGFNCPCESLQSFPSGTPMVTLRRSSAWIPEEPHELPPCLLDLKGTCDTSKKHVFVVWSHRDYEGVWSHLDWYHHKVLAIVSPLKLSAWSSALYSHCHYDSSDSHHPSSPSLPTNSFASPGLTFHHVFREITCSSISAIKLPKLHLGGMHSARMTP